MNAVIKTGGKQYRVTPGETIKVEKLDGNPGETIELTEVLLLSDGDGISLGRPFVDGAVVTAQIEDLKKGRKAIVYKYKRRKRYRRKNGHRQMYTSLRILDISGPLAQA
jgi:large subunit ribosomal protein L21